MSFDDHFSQATLFWLSMTDVERDHIVEAFTFELGKCYEQADPGTPTRGCSPRSRPTCASGWPPVWGCRRRHRTERPPTVTPSPALSQIPLVPGPIAGRVVGVVAGPGADLAGIARLRAALTAEQAVLRVIAPVGGTLGTGKRTEMVERTLLTTRSIEFDAVLIADGTAGLRDVKLSVLLQEAFRHCKALGAWGDGSQVLLDAGIDTAAPGVLLADSSGENLTSGLIAALGMHRVWERAAVVMATEASRCLASRALLGRDGDSVRPRIRISSSCQCSGNALLTAALTFFCSAGVPCCATYFRGQPDDTARVCCRAGSDRSPSAMGSARGVVGAADDPRQTCPECGQQNQRRGCGDDAGRGTGNDIKDQQHRPDDGGSPAGQGRRCASRCDTATSSSRACRRNSMRCRLTGAMRNPVAATDNATVIR